MTRLHRNFRVERNIDTTDDAILRAGNKIKRHKDCIANIGADTLRTDCEAT